MFETSNNRSVYDRSMTAIAEFDPPKLRKERNANLTAPKSGRFYRPELDTLRFLAFLGVFAFHAIPHTPDFYSSHHFLPSVLVGPICAIAGAGAFGVDLFFALSAYLITVLLLREREEQGRIDLKAFYIRRILRIWPLYFFFIAFAASVSLWDKAQHLEWPYIAGYLFLAGNWVYTWRGLPAATIAIPLWSISIEEQFYLLWPLIARRVSLANMKYVVAALLSLGYISRVLLVSAHVTGAAAEYNTFARIDPIVLGIGLAAVLRERRIKLSLVGRVVLVILCLGAWFAVSSYAALNAPWAAAPVIGTLLGRPVVAIAATGLLIAFIGAPASGARVLAHPVFVYLGRISYGLYVYHMTGLMFARHILRDENPKGHVARAALGLLLTVLISMASYRWLETPFLRLKDHFARVLSRPVQ
jgi:peptidoglycan/LPS O-acetylase OafA/YrhL